MSTDSSDRLFALSDAFRAFAEVTSDYTRLIETVADKLTQLIGDGCVIMLANDDGTWRDQGAAAARDPHANEIIRAAIHDLKIETATGLAVQVVRSGKPMVIPEITPANLVPLAQPAFHRAVELLGVRSIISVPLAIRDRTIGALTLFRYRPESPAFSDADVAFARSIADHAALAMWNSLLFESLQLERDKAKTFIALVENCTDMIATAALDGQVTFVNAAGRALVGLASDRDVRELTLADFHTAAGLARAEGIISTGSFQGEGVLRHFVTDELIPVHVSSFLARDVDGAPLCFATVQRDLRETKRLEDELRQAHKMEALGRLAGGVAHDFNNLLTVILSYAAMVAKRLPPNDRGAEHVAQIERAGERAARLTSQLLAFSRRQVLEPAPLDLGATLRAMDGMLRRLIGEDIELRVEITGDGAVVADAGQIEQVVMNLALNARDAMPRGGVLTLTTAAVALAAGPFHLLAVTDTGSGIDAQTRLHLFEPFFTTKGRAAGTGLGLSTVMGIVEQSGGHIAVDSAVDHGTTFRIYLPATTRQPPPAEAAQPAECDELGGSELVLVVEDEPAVRALVRDVLTQAGYDVLEARDARHALELAASTPGEIAVLLTDVIMPEISGRQLAARFAELRPATRVLYMSGYAEDKLGQHGVLDPGVELIQKPLTPEILLRRVRERLKQE